ncbi:hypothetical protein C8J57DRAFT_1280834 [Mycena rebaudengoi]|nr:hypothetical protein C8J57DRAFT_1280834 [Mycena rebaudengoi]
MDETYGAMLIGVLFATFFQGVLTVQSYMYYETFPGDSLKLKALVACVWILDTVHLILISQSVYHYLISSWGNDAALLVSTEPLNLHLVFIGLATILCQAFFLFRIWSLSKKNWLLTGFLAAACLTSFGFHIVISTQLSFAATVHAFSLNRAQVVVAFTMGAVADVGIAALLVFYLRRGGKSTFEKTTSVISRVIQYTVATGGITSLLAVAIVVAYEIRPNGFIHIAIHFSLARMYTNALLATLNSRKALRNVMNGGSTMTSIPHFVNAGSGLANTTLREEYTLNALKSPV